MVWSDEAGGDEMSRLVKDWGDEVRRDTLKGPWPGAGTRRIGKVTT
jgi:hypothetical protein